MADIPYKTWTFDAAAPYYPTIPAFWQVSGLGAGGSPSANYPDVIQAEAVNVVSGIGLIYVGASGNNAEGSYSDAIVADAWMGNHASVGAGTALGNPRTLAQTAYLEVTITYTATALQSGYFYAPIVTVMGKNFADIAFQFVLQRGDAGPTPTAGADHAYLTLINGYDSSEAPLTAVTIASLVGTTHNYRIAWTFATPDSGTWLPANDGTMTISDNGTPIYTAAGSPFTIGLFGAGDIAEIGRIYGLRLGGAGFAGYYSGVAEVGYIGTLPEEPDEPPDGGGEVPATTPPDAGTAPVTSFPLIFTQATIGGTDYYFAEADGMNDVPTWYGGYKPPRILSVTPVTRSLSSDGGYEASAWRVIYADVDGSGGRGPWRTWAANNTLRGTYHAVYAIDDAERRALGDPYRIAAGFVTDHRGLPGMRYELTVEDVLGQRITDAWSEPKLPPVKYTATDFPGLDDSFIGRTIPQVYGKAVNGTTGVVKAVYVGTFNLTGIGGVDVWVDAYLIAHGAVAQIADLYYNPPQWHEDSQFEIGDLIRPTDRGEGEAGGEGFLFRCMAAGTTGDTEPTWPLTEGSTTPDGSCIWENYGPDSLEGQRYVVPSNAYGTVLVAPYKPLWNVATGQATNYVPYNGRWYTPVFVRNTHRFAEALKDGRMELTADVYGTAENPDGSGRYIDQPERILQHILTNYLLDPTPWEQGPWFEVPLMNGYPMIDNDSVEAAVALSQTYVGGNGYVAGFVLGADGDQESVFDIVRRICEGSNLDIGINRHGQLIVSRLDPDAAAEFFFNATLDIEDGEFEVRADGEIFANDLEYRYGKMYFTETGPRLTPRAGEALPEWFPRTNGWESGLQRLTVNASVTAVGRKITRQFDNDIIRDATSATDIATRWMNMAVGPVPAYDGPRTFKLQTGWQGAVVELGSIIAITHPEGFGSAGYTLTRGRVMEITADPQNGRWTLSGQVLGGGIAGTPTATIAAVAVTGDAPTLVISATTSASLAPAPMAMTLRGPAPTLPQVLSRAPSVGGTAFAGAAPTLAVTVPVAPVVGALALAGVAPTLAVRADVTALPAVGALVLTGPSPLIAVPIPVTLRAIEGFDAVTLTDLATYTTMGGFNSISTATKRTGRASYSVSDSSSVLKFTNPSTPTATAVIGFGLITGGGFGGGTLAIALLYDGATTQISIKQNASGNLLLDRNGTTLATSSNALTTSTTYYIEWISTIDNTTGASEVRVNGSSTGWINVTGVDTQNSANAQWSVVGFSTQTAFGTFFDDVYMSDGTAILGQPHVLTVVASSGNGSLTDFTPSTGVDHGAMVDETTQDGDTTYVQSSTAGHVDTYNFAALGVTATVYGVEGVAFAKQSGAGAVSVRMVARIGGVNYAGTTTALGTSAYTAVRHVWQNSPATGSAWTVSEIDGAEFGVEVVSATAAARVTHVAIKVLYV